MTRPLLLGPGPHSPFPPVDWALDEPDGLLCIGGDLSLPRLLNAYANGIFPWFSEGQPILWWSPSRRMVFRSDGVRLSRRFRRELRRLDWQVRFDDDFDAVVAACAQAPRPGQTGTWIGPAMQRAYARLHAAGYAHAIAVRDAAGRLAGGLYGVSLGRAFFAESMVSLSSGGSKVALAALGWRLAQAGTPWFDAQVEHPHLHSMGGESWPRSQFLARLPPLVADRRPWRDWTLPVLPARQLAGAAGD
jgi:leucyl/phenylalanyl-tRNA--protein transferase